MHNYAFIPARSGSKGILNKNLQNIGNLSLIEISVLAAIESGIFAKIFISSDSEIMIDVACNIAKKALMPNIVEPHFRPIHLSQDCSTTESAIVDLLDTTLIPISNEDRIYILQPTSPFRYESLICKFNDSLSKSGFKCGFTASKVTPFLWKNNVAQYDIMNRKMRQDLSDEEFYYHEDGNLFCFECSVFKRTGNRIDNSPFIYITDSFQSLQIDTPADLSYCIYLNGENKKIESWMSNLI